MGMLGNLRVRISAETDDFRRGLNEARKNLGSFKKDLDRFRNNMVAQVASVGLLSAALKSSIDAANRFDNAQRQLAATAKLTGVEFATLQATSQKAQNQFKLSAISANGYTIELTKLAGKAGDLNKASAGIEAFLDLGAARGLSADETLKAVQQSILGIDEGTDKLFGKNPSVLYEEFAKKIGTTAGKLSDQQKAQAILNAAMEDGGKVRGEYQKWLESSAGQQYLLAQGMEQTQVALGKALQPALVAVLPALTTFAGWMQESIKWVQKFGASVALLEGLDEAGEAFWRGGWDDAREVMGRYLNAYRSVVAEINASGTAAPPPATLPSVTPTGDGSGTNSPTRQGRQHARQYFDGLETEWENLRHSVALKRIEVTGTDSQRLALEEAHALRLLDIEGAQLRLQRERGQLTAVEYADALRQLGVKRQLAQAQRQQMDEAGRAVATQQAGFQRADTLLQHQVEKERILSRTALERLDGEESVAERLTLQLGLVDRIYTMQRAALVADTRLSDEQLQNELLKLDLAREREQLQLRMTAAAEKEAQAIAKQRKVQEAAAKRRNELRDQALSLATSVAQGNASAESIGSGLGGMAGMAIGGPIGATIGSTLGGIAGKALFGKKEKEEDPIVKGLDAVERAQRDTITTLQQQTDSLLNPENRLLNLPSSFNVPNYNPSAGVSPGGTTVTYGDTNVSLSVTVQGGDPGDVQKAVERALAQTLQTGRRNGSWGTRSPL